MGWDEARRYAARVRDAADIDDPVPPVEEAMSEVLILLYDRLNEIERRARQVRGGLKPYARPTEIVDYIMGEET